MNQPPDPYQQYPQYPQPNAHNPNSVPPTVAASPQPPYGGVPPYPDYNQPGNYPSPGYPPQPSMNYSSQPFPPPYPPQSPEQWPSSPPQSPGQWPGPSPQAGPQRRGKTGWIIGGISAAVVVIVIVAAFLITHGFRADPPSSWLATEPIGSTSKFVYYIHWTNHDGQLNGSMDEYYYSSSSSYGSGQSQSYNLDGTYNYQDQTVTLTVHNGAESVTIKGNISGNNMTLHSPASTSTSSANRDLTFHTASQKDFDDAKQNTNSSSY